MLENRNMKRIYLDYAASTPVDPEVERAMRPYFGEKFGNPGALHFFGQEAMAAVDSSRETIAKALGAGFREIIFTGSATEANNLAIRGAVKNFRRRQPDARCRIIVSAIEHESVLETAMDLERDGVEVVYLPVDGRGMIHLEELKETLNKETLLVSIMYANNETGTLQDIRGIAKVVGEFRANSKTRSRTYPLLHTDAVQAFQFLDCNVNDLGVDLMTISGQKIYGPKGIGALFMRQGAGSSMHRITDYLSPIITGGGQEFGLRSGTENAPLIVGLANAVEIVLGAREKEAKRVGELRDYLWSGLAKIFPKAKINGSENDSERLPNILDVYFPDHKAEDLLTKFDITGLAASPGSACRIRAAGASYVIDAMGYPERTKSSIRFSLGRPTTKEEIEKALEIIRKSL